MSFRLRKVIAVVLIFSLTVAAFPVMTDVKAKGEVNDLITTFVSMAAGKANEEINEDMSKLSQKDIKFLGVYISNFFVPFVTEFGVNDSEITDENKEDIKEALQSNLYFSDSLAEDLTETLIGLSRSSSKELGFYVQETKDSPLIEVDNLTVNYYLFIQVMLGELQNTINWMTKNVTKLDQIADNIEVLDGILDGKYKYCTFGYKDGSEVIPVLDATVSGGTTPSMLAFM